MIDLKELATRPDRRAAYDDTLARRGSTVDVEAVLAKRAEVVALDTRRQSLREEAKRLARRDATEEERQRARELREQEAALDKEHEQAAAELDELAGWLPNYLDPRVPAGDETCSVEVRRREPPATGAAVRPHDEVAAGLGWLDTERAARLAGSRFYALTRDAVQLRYALVQLFLDIVDGQDWTLVSPPVLARRETLYASGYLPFAEKDNFEIVGADLSLIGTSEQAILGMMQGERLDRLPARFLGDSMCFRTEAGSHGRDVRGMLRVHQFYKLEQFVFCAPDRSEDEHQACQRNIEAFAEALELPYRTIICAAGDVGAPGWLKYDLEAWFPSQGRFRELTSNTNILDFQTRRARTRAKVDGRSVFPHTISATGFCDRHIAALLENHQQPDGSVAVPERLRPYVGGRERFEPRG